MIRAVKISFVIHKKALVNEVTFQKPLRMGLVARGTTGDQRVGTFSPTPRPLGRERGCRLSQLPMASVLTVPASVMRPPQNPRGRGRWAFGLVNTGRFKEGGAWRGHKVPRPFLILPCPGFSLSFIL